MNIYYPAWAFWFSVLQFVFNLALLVGVWWSNRQKVTAKKFKALEDRMVEVETNVKIAPVCGQHLRMEEMDKTMLLRLDSIDKGVAKIDGRLEGINRMVDLLTQNELSGGK